MAIATTIYENVSEYPSGISMDGSGKIWVSFRDTQQIKKFDWNSETETLTETTVYNVAPSPSELKYDGLYVWATHSYVNSIDYDGYDGYDVLSNIITRIEPFTNSIVNNTLTTYFNWDGYCNDYDVKISAGPHPLANNKGYLLVSAKIRIIIDAISSIIDSPFCLKIDPRTLYSNQETDLAVMLNSYDNINSNTIITTKCRSLVLDSSGGIYLPMIGSMNYVEISPILIKKFPAEIKDEEFNKIAVRNLTSGGLVIVAPATPEDSGDGYVGSGVLSTLIGTANGDTISWDNINSTWSVVPNAPSTTNVADRFTKLETTDWSFAGMPGNTVQILNQDVYDRLYLNMGARFRITPELTYSSGDGNLNLIYTIVSDEILSTDGSLNASITPTGNPSEFTVQIYKINKTTTLIAQTAPFVGNGAQELIAEPGFDISGTVGVAAPGDGLSGSFTFNFYRWFIISSISGDEVTLSGYDFPGAANVQEIYIDYTIGGIVELILNVPGVFGAGGASESAGANYFLLLDFAKTARKWNNKPARLCICQSFLPEGSAGTTINLFFNGVSATNASLGSVATWDDFSMMFSINNRIVSNNPIEIGREAGGDINIKDLTLVGLFLLE